MNRLWTEEEISFVKQNCNSKKANDIAKELGRSLHAVYTRIWLENECKKVDFDTFRKFWLDNPTISQRQMSKIFEINEDVTSELVRKCGLKNHSRLPANLYIHVSKHALAYTAGFIDAEGSIGIVHSIRWNHHEYRPVVSASNINKNVLNWLKYLFGGFVRFKRRNQFDTRRDIYAWEIRGGRVRQLLELLSPLLKVKRSQAEALLGAYERGIFFDHFGHATKEITRERERLYQALKKMNAKGKHVP